MDELQESWVKRGLGLRMDRLWIPTMGYEDDVTVPDTTEEGAKTMLLDRTQAFEKACLEVGMEKTNWSSTLRKRNYETLDINGESIR